MGFLDKATVDKLKESTQLAVQQAQAGIAQGQAKVDAFQLKRQTDALFRELGAAYYATQRRGASPDLTAAAMARLDAHIAAHGPIDPDPPRPATGGSTATG